MQGNDLLVAGMLLAVMVLAGKMLIPIAQAYARRLESGGTGAQGIEALADLEARVRELEVREARVVELEERVDFTERMLARQREVQGLGLGDPR